MGCCCNNRAWDTVGIKGPKRVQLFWKAINGRLRPGRPLALSEPEPTRPFGIPLPEPTYLHRPDLYLHDFELF